MCMCCSMCMSTLWTCRCAPQRCPRISLTWASWWLVMCLGWRVTWDYLGLRQPPKVPGIAVALPVEFVEHKRSQEIPISQSLIEHFDALWGSLGKGTAVALNVSEPHRIFLSCGWVVDIWVLFVDPLSMFCSCWAPKAPLQRVCDHRLKPI